MKNDEDDHDDERLFDLMARRAPLARKRMEGQSLTAEEQSLLHQMDLGLDEMLLAE